MMSTRKFLSMLAIASLVMYSCSDDDDNPTPVNEEELITTMTVTLTGGGQTVVLSTVDLDGEDGPNAPVVTVTGGALAANTTYTGSIGLLNQAEDPEEDVREEDVEPEADEHQIFFQATGGLNVTTAYADTESDYGDLTGTNPVGLEFTLETGDASTGDFTVTLRHQPKKPNDGTLADAGGDTDITATFDLEIQ